MTDTSATKVVGRRQVKPDMSAAEYHHRAVIIQQQADRLNPFDKPRRFIFKARSREEYELWKSQQTNPRLW